MPDKKIFSVEERIKIALEDGDFNGASNTIERFLDENPTCSKAYLYRALIEFKFSSIEELKLHGAPLDNNANFKRAMEFASDEEKIELEEISKAIVDRISSAKNRRIYNEAMQDFHSHRYIWAIEKFESIKGFEDASSKIDECKVAWEERKRVVRYKNAVTIANEARNTKSGIKKLEKAIEILSVDITYANSAELIKSYKNSIDNIERNRRRVRKISLTSLLSVLFVTVAVVLIVFNFIPNSKYDKGMDCLDKGDYKCAIKYFDDLDDYKESEDMKYIALTLQELDSHPEQKLVVIDASNAMLDAGVKVKATYTAPDAFEGVREKNIPHKQIELYGEPVSLNGYTFNGWTLDSYEFDINKEVLVLNFTGSFTIKEYSISFNVVEPGAQIVGDYVTKYTVEDTVNLPTVSLEGYSFAGWRKGTGVGAQHIESFGPGEYSENLTLYATYSANIYFATPKPTNGYISFGSSNYYKTGEEVTMWITPNANHELRNLYYQKTGDANAPRVNIQGNKFIMPGYDVTVYGIFTEIQYNVTVHIDNKHSLNVNSKYYGNSDIEINVELRPGYHLTALYYTVGDSSTKHTINNGEIIKMPYSDINIYVEAIPYTYSIYKNIVGSGTLNVSTVSDVDSEVEIVFTPNEGSYIEEIYYILDGTAQKVAIENNKFIMPAGNVTVYVVFKEYLTLSLVVDGTSSTYDVKQGTKLKDVFDEAYDLNHTIGYYTDSLCREWSNPELDVTDGMVLYTKVATLDILKFSADNTQVYVTSYDYKKDLIIPAYHNDVKILKYNGFEEREYSASFKGIYLPYGITEIGDYAFFCTYLVTEIAELYIPSTVKVVGNEAFREYGDAENDKLIFGGVVESVGDNAFDGLDSELTFDFEHVKYIGKWAFARTNVLSNLVLSSAVEIGWFAFAYSSVVNVTINGNPKMGAAVFDNCESLETISAPNLTTIDGGMFLAGCSSLKSAYLPKITEVSNNMFNGCSSLEEFVISDGVTVIGAKAFYLSGVKNLVIPTSVDTIWASAFDNCLELKYVILHENIKTIYKSDEYVNMTTTIYFEGDDLKLATVNVDDGIDIKTYSESPIYDGNHWHYVDGIPTIYTK